MRSIRLRRYLSDARGAFERAPVEVLLALLVAATLSYAIESVGEESTRAWAEWAATAGLAAVAAWTGTLLHALGDLDARRRWAVTAAGAIAAALYGAFVLRLDLVTEGWRMAALLAGAALWALAVPALTRGGSDEVRSAAASPTGPAVPGAGTPRGLGRAGRFRLIAGRLLLRAAGAGLYTAALFAGLALALLAINTLFELELRSTIYVHLLGWLAFGMVPLLVVGGLPGYVEPRAEPDRVAAVVRRGLGFLVPPLLVLYYVILYAYAIRIAVTGEMPQNLVSPLVIAAGVLAALGLIVFDPRPGDPPLRRLLRLAPPLFLPLGFLGLLAMAPRIGQYGWTEFRYLRALVLVVFTALAIAGTMELVRRRGFRVHVAPLALAVALFLSSFGPWSVSSVAKRSQEARLRSALVEIDALGPDGRVRVPADRAARTVPAATYTEISSTSRYLGEHFGAGALEPWLPEAEPGADGGADADGEVDDTPVEPFRPGAVREADPERPIDLALRLRLQPAPEESATEVWRGRAAVPPGARIAELPAGTVYRVALPPPAQGGTLRLDLGGERFSAELGPLLAWLGGIAAGREVHSRASARDAVIPTGLAALELMDGSGRVRGVLLVLEIIVHSDAGEARIDRLEAVASVER